MLGGSKRRYARVGDVITVSKTRSATSDIKTKTVTKAVIVRTASPLRREDGSTVRFDSNSVVLIDKDGNPRFTYLWPSGS